MIANEDTAAHHLLAARRAGYPGPRLPEDARPADIEAALLVQRNLVRLLDQSIEGWKCSLPTTERPIALAPIFAPTITSTSPCTVTMVANGARIEPEIAFVIGHDLPSRDHPYSEAEILAAIREMRLVLELIGSRFTDPATLAYPELLADNIANAGLFVGPIVAGGIEHAPSTLQLSIDMPQATIIEREGHHPDGHPLRPLLWLANFLAERGDALYGGLRTGQIVTTGSFAGILEVPFATPLDVRFGDLGTLSVEFIAPG